MKDRRISPEKVRALKDRLPHNSYSKIAKDTEKPYGSVADVMNGRRYNKAIILSAIAIIKESEKEIKEVEDALDSII